MAGSFRMEHVMAPRMEQRLKLSPRMLQSMRVLQLPILALREHIDQELAENPTLEVEGDESEPLGSEEITAESPTEERAETDDSLPAGEVADPSLEPNPQDESEPAVGENGQDDQSFERLEEQSDQLDNLWEAADVHSTYRQDADHDPHMEMLANTPEREETLLDDLKRQFSLLSVSPQVRRAGEMIIENLNDRGFLTTPLETLSTQFPPGEKIQTANFVQALDQIQNLDPPGVGARDARECFLIQLERLEPEVDPDHLRPVAARLVADHFDDLEHNRLPTIEKKTGLPMARIEAAVRFISLHCDPLPGLSAAKTENQPVVPDVVLKFNEAKNDYDVEITDTGLPSLTISPYYRRQLESGTLDTQTRKYLLTKIKDSNWLVQAIEQRRAMLTRVVREVVEVQREFIEQGPAHLKPLPMHYLSRRLGVHVATISRTVADKYVQGPRGIFRLRDCFSSGTQTQNGEEMSYDAVREKMREIIAAEDRSVPYSDDALVEKLKSLGITLARRTVAKYREELDIPPARRRKQHGVAER